MILYDASRSKDFKATAWSLGGKHTLSNTGDDSSCSSSSVPVPCLAVGLSGWFVIARVFFGIMGDGGSGDEDEDALRESGVDAGLSCSLFC